MSVSMAPEMVVWVKPANSVGFVNFSSTPWTIADRLIPIRSVMRPGGMGEASFKMLRRQRNDGFGAGTWTKDLEDYAALGSYVAIAPLNSAFGTGADPTSSENEQCLWWGVITKRDFSIMGEEDDELGSVSALGYGYLLDRGRIKGFRQMAPTGGTEEEGEVLLSNPVANPSVGESLYVGNMETVTFGGETLPFFTRYPASVSDSVDNTYWTRQKLVEHILRWCRPNGIPEMRLIGTENEEDETNALDALATVEKTSFDLRNLTFKGALDLLIPRSRGLTWSLWPREGFWYVWVDSLATVAVGDLTANPARDIELNDTMYVDVSMGEEVKYDSVELEGGPILHTFTVSVADENLAKGWDVSGATTNEDAFLAGASGDVSYDSWSTERQKKANREIRQSLYSSVFTRYILAPDADGNLQRRVEPGTDTGDDVLAIPFLEWSGAGTPTLDLETDATPYLPETRIERNIPWPIGVGIGGPGSADDKRTAEQKGRPQYLPPRIFRYDSAQDAGLRWRDLNAIGDGWGAPQVDIDDRGPALRVTYTPPEMMAKDHWTGAALGDLSPDPDSNPYSLNWEHLVCTICVPSGQMLRVTRYADGYTAETARNPLRIKDDRYNCWVTHAGTILQIKADGDPDRIAATTFTRNDYPAAQKVVDMTSAFALQTRRPAEIELTRADVRLEWAEVGELIGRLVRRKAPTSGGTQGALIDYVDVNCTVEEVERSYGDAPRIIVRTSLPELPSFGAMPASGGSASPGVAGAPVSVVNGGATGQVLQSLRQQVAKVEQRTMSIPVIPPRTTGTASRNVRVAVLLGGNTINPGATSGIAYTATAPVSIPDYDPSAVPSTVDGVGSAYDAQTGEYLLVANYASAAIFAGANQNPRDYFAGELVLLGPTTTLPITGGGGATETLYVIIGVG